MRSAAWSFSEHRTAVDVIKRFPGLSAFQPRPRRHLGGPSFFHFSPTEAFPPSFLTLFHSSRPHTSTSAKRFNSRMWSHTTSCFCNSAKNCQGFFCPLFFLQGCPTPRPPRPLKKCDTWMWSHSLIAVSVFGLSVLKCSDVALAVLLKAPLFSVFYKPPCCNLCYEFKMFSLKFWRRNAEMQ